MSSSDNVEMFDEDGANAPSAGISDYDNAGELRSRNAQLVAENARLMEAVESRDAFLAIVGHELRNPMTPIIGRITVLRHMIGKPDITLAKIGDRLEQLEWLISRYVQRATTLLDISRVNSGKFTFNPKLIDVCALIREVVESVSPIAEHAGSTIALELPSEGMIIHSDRLSLEQIIDNLVSNAIKYGAGTPILISATSHTENAVAVICVSDCGPGIAPIDQARIFERFERAVHLGGQTGFGVGLWIVRQLTEAMGGTIAVHSDPGAGSTFTLTMPLQSAKETK